MKKIALLLSILLISNLSYAWGAKGHSIVADIASKHISKQTTKKVDAILQGETMVAVSTWMDGLRGNPKYTHTSTWHYLNVDPGFTYQTSEKEPAGDVYNKTLFVIEQLKSHKLSPEDEQDYLRMLIHMVADLHCPMHTGYKYDRGGNLHQVQWFGVGTNLHSVWDSKLIDSARPWSYSEWTTNIDNLSKAQVQAITQSSIDVWRDECLVFRDVIYASTPVGANLSYDYNAMFVKGTQDQLLKAGLRLANILNQIYQ